MIRNNPSIIDETDFETNSIQMGFTKISSYSIKSS